jgi:hypothetical protein
MIEESFYNRSTSQHWAHSAISSFADEMPQRVDLQHRLPPMQHRMAVGANRAQVFDRIKHISFPDLTQRLRVVNMDKASSVIIGSSSRYCTR